MRRSLLSLSAGILTGLPLMVGAQDAVWVQVEAQPSLPAALSRAEVYAEERANVAGYYLGTGWYGIALGPYSPADAESLMSRLKSSGAIPADSFVADGARFRSQFFPVGEGAPTEAQPLPGSQEATAPTTPAPADVTEEAADTPDTTESAAEDTPPAAPETPTLRDAGETLSEAQASERALTREDKRALQVALKWSGHYNGAIDGLYGRGTRASMAAWQTANAYPDTGTLTTSQRAELLAAYNAILDGMDLQVVQDDASGIRMQIPTGVVEFARYEPPFVHFDASGDLAARVLLISQRGDRDTMAGLYEIMQTLEIVPEDGPRELRRDGFTLEGRSDALHSETHVTLENGVIKGFTLIWPANDEARRSRIIAEMRPSFERIDGVLDPSTITPGSTQAADLVSGLTIRKPKRARSGLFVSNKGHVLTTAEAVQDCGRITVNGDHEATVLTQDDDLAILTPMDALAPQAIGTFQQSAPRLQSMTALAGFPYGGILPTAAMTFGALADLKGLDGDPEVLRLSMAATEGELGGPIFDNTGHVMGMLSPVDTHGKHLTGDVAFAIDGSVLRARLDSAGVPIQSASAVSYKTEEQITTEAAKMTVLVRCWD